MNYSIKFTGSLNDHQLLYQKINNELENTITKNK